MSSYSIEGHDGVISGEGIQVYRTAAEAAQHHANRTGESWYVIDDETGEREAVPRRSARAQGSLGVHRGRTPAARVRRGARGACAARMVPGPAGH